MRCPRCRKAYLTIHQERVIETTTIRTPKGRGNPGPIAAFVRGADQRVYAASCPGCGYVCQVPADV